MDPEQYEPSSLPWFREELRKKMAALEQEIAAHRHTLDLLRQTENAYGRFVPHQILRLLHTESILDLPLGKQIESSMTIMFSDIREFTHLCEGMAPKDVFYFINSFLGEMEPLISERGGIVDKYIGDAIMALFPTSADDGLRAATATLAQLLSYNAGRARAGYVPIQIGIGLNTGIVMLGTIGGTQHMQGTVLGDAVNLASRLEETTKIYDTPLLISEHTLYALVDPSMFHIRFLDRIHVKGKNQPQSVYEVFDNDPAQVRAGKQATQTQFEKAVAYYHLKKMDKAIPLLEACLRDVPADRPAQIYLERSRDYLETGRYEGAAEICETLEWRNEFVVGVDEIDDQHRELVARMNSLAARISSGDASWTTEILEFLADYVHFHFDSEEKLMRAIDYPFLGAHLQEHRSFVSHFARLKSDISSGLHDPLYLSFRIQLFLFDWFANHTTKTDRHLGNFLRAKNKRGSSEPC